MTAMMSNESKARSPYSGDAPSSSDPAARRVSPHAGRCVVVWGELVWDDFPEESRLGGGAVRVASHLQRLGADAQLVSAVANDAEGDRALAELAARGLSTAFVARVAGARTGRVRVTPTNGDARYELVQQGPRVTPQPSAALAAALARADGFCFSVLAQREPSDFDAIATAVAGLAPGAPRLCDLNLRRPFASQRDVERALELASLVKLNEQEASALCQLVSCANALDWLLARANVELVALTRGAQGALLATRLERFEHRGFPARAGANAVGAGDAFDAALLLERLAGSSVEQLAERANRYAAGVVGVTDTY
jgi:fructokinase